MFYNPKQWATPAYDFHTIDKNPYHTALATTLYGSNGLPSPNVVLWRTFWSQKVAGQEQTLFHEFTHILTKEGDLQLDRRFAIDTRPFGGDNLGSSAAYDKWLQGVCGG